MSTTRVVYDFKGLMAPVFTHFNDDKRKTVNYDLIDDYAKYLKENHIEGVLVNGTSGEGMCMSVLERKETAERWYTACRKYDMNLMLQIGGASITDVLDLAEHAELLQVDAVLCLPDLFFKPITSEDLINYLKQISKYCPTRPLLYYHNPGMSGVSVDMPTFLDGAEKHIDNFVGCKYTSGDMEVGLACLKKNRSVFLGSDKILVGAMMLGFDSFIMTTINIFPELVYQMVTLIERGKGSEAKKVQDTLNERIRGILVNQDWVFDMKAEYNRQRGDGFSAGPMRILPRFRKCLLHSKGVTH